MNERKNEFNKESEKERKFRKISLKKTNNNKKKKTTEQVNE